MQPHELCPITDLSCYVVSKLPWVRPQHPAALRFQAACADLESTLGVDSLLHRGLCAAVYGTVWVLNLDTRHERTEEE